MAQNLKQTQEKQKQDTIQRLQAVIDFIKLNEGQHAIISMQKLITYSDGVFYKSLLYKEHVLKVWNPSKWEEKYGKLKIIRERSKDKDVRALQQELTDSLKKIKELERKNSALKMDNDNIQAKYKGLKLIWEEEQHTNAMLRGEILTLQSRLAARGL
ncbi:hypothetical protein [Paenibacillus sp. DMB5]|uniref:hypothetical protein n=1 Tax=Paenibacillus sp. DMB5 TaxID=1780103 RepID=UPI00076CB996|nr:hypothetical protein [Paenibacillus sp. DMB5]KUP25796.1 hypothetical protein AWJ19_19420 [Paenibacillus sp. DMB5]